PQQAHSYELQVLGETGIVGGVFAFGGILLVLGAVLWPRLAAGWRLARNTWLRPRRPAGTGDGATAIDRPNDSRWGNDPTIYGWQIALLCGAAYWLIHASVDWLWQMGGVSIPAVLLVAAAVAGVDAKAGVLWPRLSRRSRMGSSEPEIETAPADPQSLVPPSHPDVAGDSDGLLLIPHRADQYADRIERRRRRVEKRRRSRELFRPPGILSHFFRLFLVAVSLIVIIFAGLPYISMLYQDSAKALARKDAYRASERAEAASWLLPSDPGPYSTQASIYGGAALQALESDDPGRGGAVLDNLALAIGSLEDAIALEPADWTLRFQAGVTTLDLMLARGYAEGQTLSFDYSDLSPEATGLRDWSALASVAGQIPAPGTAAASLARDEDRLATATRYRDLTTEQLVEMALDFLQAADERNPLADQVDATVEILRRVTATTD
ncbi:MAG: hypothetical protein JW990_02590, partial [Thermoleophilia bacterium]|nr:hypothetical protein [Thermoleophilia bacterium]